MASLRLVEIAKSMGLAPSALSRMLGGGRQVGPQSAKKIAAFLGKPKDWRDYVHIKGDDLRLLLTR